MPIRFRCVSCGKLLGIARRKAGSIVGCPACKEQLLVPNHDAVGAGVVASDQTVHGQGMKEEEGTPPVQKVESKPLGGQLFERSDFEELLNPEPVHRANNPSRKKRDRESPPPIPLELRDNPFDREKLDPAKPKGGHPPGIVISANRATWLSVAAVVLLAVVFGIGLLVGRFLKP